MITLFDLAVPNYLQGLKGLSKLLDVAKEHALELEWDLNDLIRAAIIEDMNALPYQVAASCHHSFGALQAIEQTTFGITPDWTDKSFDELRTSLNQTIEKIETITPDRINQLEEQTVEIHIREHKVPFLARDFVLSFSLPSFYFHIVTTYNILRMKGLRVGKINYLGPIRMQNPPAT